MKFVIYILRKIRRVIYTLGFVDLLFLGENSVVEKKGQKGMIFNKRTNLAI